MKIFVVGFDLVCFAFLYFPFLSLPGKIHEWLSNFLTNAEHNIEIDKVKSSMNSIDYRVPQGSVVGPRLLAVQRLQSLASAHSSVFLSNDTAHPEMGVAECSKV